MWHRLDTVYVSQKIYMQVMMQVMQLMQLMQVLQMLNR